MHGTDVISKVLSDPDRTRVCEALSAERPGEGFSLDRYYLTEREAAPVAQPGAAAPGGSGLQEEAR